VAHRGRHLVKARRATKGSGIANLSDSRVRANLDSKYPPSTTEYQGPSDAALLLLRQDPIDHHRKIIDDTESLANFITSKKERHPALLVSQMITSKTSSSFILLLFMTS
jgi:hypothetical protein